MLDAMNDKLLENAEFLSKPKANDSPAFQFAGRKVQLPEGCDMDSLAKLSPGDLRDKMRDVGGALGYAVLLRQASGQGDTPAGAQAAAAEFLVKHAEQLRKDEDQGDVLTKRLRRLNTDQLTRLLDMLDAEETADVHKSPSE